MTSQTQFSFELPTPMTPLDIFSTPAQDFQRYSAAEVARFVRTALKERFPGTTFRVQTTRGTSLRVSWIDGPTELEVSAVCRCFDGASVELSNDMRSYTSCMFQGRPTKFGSNFVFPQRAYSPEFLGRMMDREAKRWGVDPLPIAVSSRDGHGWIVDPGPRLQGPLTLRDLVERRARKTRTVPAAV